MNTTSRWVGTGLLVGSVLIVLPFYTVAESEAVIITQFGRPVAMIRSPGLHVKWPWQSRIALDTRRQTFSPQASELLTRDRKNLIVDSYTVWRIADPQRFLQSVSDRQGAESRLQDILKSEISIALGNHDLNNLISTNPHQIQIEEIMREVTSRCRAAAGEQYGIEICDVRLRRINLPEENKESVFARMRAERERIARQIRAEGAQEATRIRAEADRQKTEILARAYEEAEKARGDGDAQSMRIYADAYNRDPKFYRLTRTLDAYKKFMNEKTTVVLSSDSALMRLMTSGKMEGAR